MHWTGTATRTTVFWQLSGQVAAQVDEVHRPSETENVYAMNSADQLVTNRFELHLPGLRNDERVDSFVQCGPPSKDCSGNV